MEITLKNISYKYKNKKLIDNINLTVEPNKITGITGDYKSLLCEIISGINYKISSGKVYIDSDILNKETIKKIRSKVCLIHQNSTDQFFTNNVKEEMLFLIKRYNYEPKDINKKMNQALDLVGLNKSYLNKNIDTLSCGEKKLIQVAVGLLNNPKIIIFDESFQELDYTNQKNLIKIIKKLKDNYDKTIIISSNDCNLLYKLTDNLVILKKGKILASDNTKKIYENEKFLKNEQIDIPDLVKFTMLAREKKIKLSYHKDILDLIKDVYKHV